METTPTDAYRAARERLDRQIGQLNHLVRAHVERQAKNPGHWGHPGDLAQVTEVLNDAIEFLGGTRHETTEAAQR